MPAGKMLVPWLSAMKSAKPELIIEGEFITQMCTCTDACQNRLFPDSERVRGGKVHPVVTGISADLFQGRDGFQAGKITIIGKVHVVDSIQYPPGDDGPPGGMVIGKVDFADPRFCLYLGILNPYSSFAVHPGLNAQVNPPQGPGDVELGDLVIAVI